MGLPSTRGVLAASLTLLSIACGNGDEPPGGSAATFFPSDPGAEGWERVRACRAPGEHSALSGFDVWVDPPSVAAFDALWAGTADPPQMPEGSIVLKVVYDTAGCDADSVAGAFAMKKVSGFDPSGGDWHWQEVDRSGELVVDGRDAGCTGCHLGGPSTTCIGYGADNGLDYLCTEP